MVLSVLWGAVAISCVDLGGGGDVVREILASLKRIVWHLVRHYAMAILTIITVAGLAWMLGFSISGVLHGRVR